MVQFYYAIGYRENVVILFTHLYMTGLTVEATAQYLGETEKLLRKTAAKIGETHNFVPELDYIGRGYVMKIHTRQSLQRP